MLVASYAVAMLRMRPCQSSYSARPIAPASFTLRARSALSLSSVIAHASVVVNTITLPSLPAVSSQPPFRRPRSQAGRT